MQSLLRTVARRGPTVVGQQCRRMSGKVSHEEEVKEMNKWRCSPDSLLTLDTHH